MTEVKNKRHSAKEVRYILDNYYELKELQYLIADRTASDVLISIDKALSKTELTERERTIIDLRFNKHMKLGAIGELIGGKTYELSREINVLADKISDNI